MRQIITIIRNTTTQGKIQANSKLGSLRIGLKYFQIDDKNKMDEHTKTIK